MHSRRTDPIKRSAYPFCQGERYEVGCQEGRERAKVRGMKTGRPAKLTDHQKREAIRRRDHGEETLAYIGRSYNVSGWTISKLGNIES